MVDTFKQANPEIIPILHCDGAVAELLDDIKDIGFEVFNPVQPGVPGHLPQDMKDRFGSKFAFWGAIDQQDLLPNGTDEDLEKDILEKISILGKNGGYMIAPAHIYKTTYHLSVCSNLLNYVRSMVVINFFLIIITNKCYKIYVAEG